LDCAGRAIAATALSGGDELGNFNALRACESGVALRLPPQSKIAGASGTRKLWTTRFTPPTLAGMKLEGSTTVF